MTEKIVEQGIVYILTNPAMPGLVKIGMTTRDNIDNRMKELFGTGVPVPFDCIYACYVKQSDCSKIEKALHKAFSPNRINPNREFFKIDPEQVIPLLSLFNQKDITREIDQEIKNDLTDTDKKSGEKLKRAQRPPLNFVDMGIPVGSTLVLSKPDGTLAEARVCSNRKVQYEGKEKSLTALTRELLKLKYDVQPTPYWRFNGRSLLEIYNETYTPIE